MPRTVLITGAAGHLGRAVAAHFAAQGDRLALLARTTGAAQAALPAGLPGSRGLPLGADLRERHQVQDAVATALLEFGRIDVLVNAAGGFAMGTPVHATDDSAWERLFDLNVRSLRHAVAAVVPAMLNQGSGCIVNVGAAGARQGQALMGAYAASKDAVARLTESLSAELRDQGIRVNAVLPSTLDTPDNRAAMPDADPTRWVTPVDLASVIGFLASDAARAVHGVCLPVTGRS